MLLSFPQTREEQFNALRDEIELRCRPDLKENVLEEASTVRAGLQRDEDLNLRFIISEPLRSELGAQPIEDSPNGGAATQISLGDPEVVESEATERSTPVMDSDVPQLSWQEEEIPVPKMRSCKAFWVHFPRSARIRKNSIEFAGLSEDCKHVFFHDDQNIAVFHFGDTVINSTSPTFSMVVNERYKDNEPILHVASSQTFLIIVTTNRILTLKLADSRIQLGAIVHENWEPSGLACHETANNLIVVLGQGQGNSSRSAKGQIIIYKYRLDSIPRRLSVCSTINLPIRDSPKRVSLDTSARILTCVTNIQNKVFVWHLDENLSPLGEPFDIFKNHSRKVPPQTPPHLSRRS